MEDKKEQAIVEAILVSVISAILEAGDRASGPGASLEEPRHYGTRARALIGAAIIAVDSSPLFPNE